MTESKKMDPCWKNLPLDLSERVCNALTKVRRIDPSLSDEIVNQWYKYDTWYFNTSSLFGFELANYVMYDDMIHVMKLTDIYPEEMCIDDIIKDMWKRLTPEQRDELIMCS
jgi:hypothetical protein